MLETCSAAHHRMPNTGDPTRYWTTLVTAGELLTTTPNPDTRIKFALLRCRTHATQAAQAAHP
ncbi:MULTISPECIES: hypothetical protein [Streptomyces]|uniref:hypothetical protein n=1 Tax=Streptomyces TaxID=1883 RepID=UPI0004C16EE1|nr:MULTISPECIES: hypothetical protein [Streptomyces]